jgi:hypothetical protein
MKKMLVLFAVLILAGGFAFAQDIGLSVGAEFGVEDINKPNGMNPNPYLKPMLIFERSFGDLDIYAELNYTYGFTKVFDGNVDHGNEVNPQELYFGLELGYNLGIGPTSTISVLLANENTFQIAPKIDEFMDSFKGVFKPGVKLTQGLYAGDIYAQADLPITYRNLYSGVVDEFTSGLDLSIGWDSNSGFGAKLKAYNLLTPDSDWFTLFDILLSYETDSFYGEVLAEIPRELKDEGGATITPRVEYNFGKFTFYGLCKFAGLGSDLDVGISPGLGLKINL